MRRKNMTGEMMMDYMAQALLLLLPDTPYDRITVGTLTQRAGVDRSTYYRHFETKEAVVCYYYHFIMQECQEAFIRENTTDFRVYMRTRFETLYAHKEDLLNLHRAGLSHLLLDVLMERFQHREMTVPEPIEEQFRTSYHLGGIYNNMLLWFSHGMAESPEKMTEMAMSYRSEESLAPWIARR